MQRVNFEPIPGTRYDQYIFKLRLVLGFVTQPGGNKFKAFRDFMRKQNLWDKDKSEILFSVVDISWDKTTVKLGKTANLVTGEVAWRIRPPSVRITGADNVVETLQRMVSLVGRNAKRRHLVELFCVLSAESTPIQHSAHEFFASRHRSIVKELTTAYDQVRQAGGLREGVDPRVAAQQFVAVMDGAQLQWLLNEESIDMVEVVRSHLASQLAVTNVADSPPKSVVNPPR